MLTNEDIQVALVNLVKINAALPYPVHFNRVRKSDKSYIWIEIRASKKSFDSVYFQREMVQQNLRTSKQDLSEKFIFIVIKISARWHWQKNLE